MEFPTNCARRGIALTGGRLSVYGLVWALAGFGVLMFMGVGCRMDSAQNNSAGLGSSQKEGVKYAQFFWFSARGDTLWLQDKGGTATAWIHHRAGAPHRTRGNAEGLVHTIPADCALATWSTTHAPYLLALDTHEAWRAAGFIHRIADIPAALLKDLTNLGGDGGLDEEALVASGAQLLTSYPFGDPMKGVAERTGIPVMSLSEYAEPHPLGRAEYIKVFGWLTGKMDTADAIFEGIAGRYESLRKRGREAAEKGGYPLVFTGSEQGGAWTAPAGDGLVARLVEDAGGAYLIDEHKEQQWGLRRKGSNVEMDREQFALMAAEADAWGKVVFAPEGWHREDAEQALSWLPLSDKLLFHCNTAETDYFGRAVIEPDRMLSDLVSILHGLPRDTEGIGYFQKTLPRP